MLVQLLILFNTKIQSPIRYFLTNKVKIDYYKIELHILK
jgi:hypothetical protein